MREVADRTMTSDAAGAATTAELPPATSTPEAAGADTTANGTAAAPAPAPRAAASAGPEPAVLWFEDVNRGETARVGGKGANLGEMTAAGLPVPPGFVVTAEAYRAFMDGSAAGAEVRSRLATLDVYDPGKLSDAARELQALVVRAPMPDAVRRAIVQAYAQLAGQGGSDAFVAVRSSATAEDAPDYSFAGMFRSFLNVWGPEELVRTVKECWASAFGARVLFYRVRQGMTAEGPVAVVVQRMVNSEKAGVLFTANPATNDTGTLVVEAAFGLGEVVVGGQVTPDRYEIDKATREVVRRSIGRKDFMIVRDEASGRNRRVERTGSDAAAEVLTEADLASITRLGLRLEAHYGAPQDAEWALEGGDVYLVQTRPITTLLERGSGGAAAAAAEVLVHGLGASPGWASGPVRVLPSPDDVAKLQSGEVLVAQATTPDWVPAMRRAAAIVTDAGGMTSHAAIVSRELGIPCIVGARDATRTLHTGLVVTVDAHEGRVLQGVVDAPAAAAPAPDGGEAAGAAAAVTGTRVYVNLADPDRAVEVAARDVDGVGLLRAEFMVLRALENRHPRALLAEGRGAEFVERMSSMLRTFAAAFAPRPVIYRAIDFRTNEFRGLEGGAEFEPLESNPMIGYRGCFRYTQEPDLFRLELEAIRLVRADHPNLHLMLPFVRTGREFRECRKLIDESGLGADPWLELWVMAEVPSVVYWLEEYVAQGATGVSIGSNDLTQLVLGVDRDSARLASLFDERDPAVLDTIRRIIAECHRLGVTCSICGQAPSVHPDYVDHLVEWGIDSVSVAPDAVETTRRHIAAAERKLLLERARDDEA